MGDVKPVGVPFKEQHTQATLKVKDDASRKKIKDLCVSFECDVTELGTYLFITPPNPTTLIWLGVGLYETLKNMKP